MARSTGCEMKRLLQHFNLIKTESKILMTEKEVAKRCGDVIITAKDTNNNKARGVSSEVSS